MRSASQGPAWWVATSSKDEVQGFLRPMRIPSDVRDVVDLLQIAFSQGEFQNPETLRELKLMRYMIPLFTLSSWLGDDLEGFFSGFVWEEGSRVVGSVSVHRSSDGVGAWLVSNLVVHPSRRGKGIARRLMRAAKEHAVGQGGSALILKVRTGNVAANHLYKTLGFQRFAREARLTKPSGVAPLAPVESSCQVRRARAEDVQTVKAMLKRAATEELGPPHLFNRSDFVPTVGGSLGGWLRDALSFRHREAWAVEREGEMLAYLDMTTNWLLPFQRRIRLIPGSHCEVSDVRALAAAALRSLGDPVKAEVKLTMQTWGERELEQDLRDLGFIEVNVQDSLWLNLERQGGSEKNA